MKTTNLLKTQHITLLFLIVISCFGLTNARCYGENKDKKTDAIIIKDCCKKINDKSKLTLKITGMTCGNCANEVSTTLNQNKNIKKVSVSFPKGKAFIEFKKDSKTTNAKVIGEIIDLGYTAEIEIQKCKKCLATKSGKK